jgi:hypothetical protein
MDFDPIDGSPVVASSFDSHSCREGGGAAAEFVATLRARYREGPPLRIDERLATVLAGNTDGGRCRRRSSNRLVRATVAGAGTITFVAALAGANALPAAAQGVVARVAEVVGISLPSATQEHVGTAIPNPVSSPAGDSGRSTSFSRSGVPEVGETSRSNTTGNESSAETNERLADVTTPSDTIGPDDPPAAATPSEALGADEHPGAVQGPVGQGPGVGDGPGAGQGANEGQDPGQGAGSGHDTGSGNGDRNANGPPVHPETTVQRGPS